MTANYYVKAVAFLASLSVPLLTPIACAYGTTWLTPVVVFLVFPVAGLMIGQDRSVPTVRAEHNAWLQIYFYVLPHAYAVLWVGGLFWGANLLGMGELEGWPLGGFILSLAITSAFATCVAHELQHHYSPFDRAVARLMMAMCGYGHLVLEHHHHHATVGDADIGGTPRKGEGAYAFVLRNVRQGALNAWDLESKRLAKHRLGWWHNRIVQDYALVVGLASFFYVVWGFAGLGVYIAQAAFTVFAFEMITYNGLVRRPSQKIGPEHAWAHNCWLTNCLTFNIAHHSEHHLNVSIPYYNLRRHPAAPKLPACYFVMFVSALIPLLCRLVMDKRTDRHLAALEEATPG
jgi:alkane 1-monooxygenase